MSYKRSNLITLSILGLVLVVLWIGTVSLDNYRIAPLDAAVGTRADTDVDRLSETFDPSDSRDSINTSRRSVAAAERSELLPQAAGSPDIAAQDIPLNLARLDVLTEIGKRIAEEQYQEAENELEALFASLDILSDAEKSAFLDFYIDYTENNFFDAEAVTAFDQLWSMLAMGTELRLASARVLGLHYVDAYELALAIPLLEQFAQSNDETDAAVLQKLSHAYFGMHQYDRAIPYLLQTIDFQFSRDLSVQREVFSELFEAYNRTGDPQNAEIVGIEILAQFNDIQDWKDMQRFYESTGDAAGLQTHMENARAQGFVSRDKDWIE